MAMFAQSLGALKKRASQIGGSIAGAVESQVGVQLSKGDGTRPEGEFPVDFSQESSGYPVGGPVMVLYSLQNGKSPGDKDFAAFMLPGESTASAQVTVGIIHSNFPLQGRFHFRFRVPTPDQTFGGYMWVDLNDDADQVPVFRGAVSMKALQLPDEAGVRRLEPIPIPAGFLFAASPVNFAESNPHVIGGGDPRQQSAMEPQVPQSLFSAEARSAPAQHKTPVSSPSPNRTSANLMSDDLQFNPDQPATRVKQAPKPADDLMDFGGSSCEGGRIQRSQTAPVLSSTPPPPPVVMPDREELVRKRLEEKERRIQEAANNVRGAADAETTLRAAKVAASYKLGPELDQWAKTSDGQNWKEIRSLLSTLHGVAWTDCTWKQISLADLLAKGSTKKVYYKAILVFHPDRHQEAEPERQYRADRIFQALNESYKMFKDD